MATRLDPPQAYDADHRAVWAEAIERLTASGRVFRTDPEVLTAYVEAVISHRKASEIIGQSSVMIIRDGQARENPALGVQQRTARAMAAASKALGLDQAPANPIAEAVPAVPIARRWCDEHQRHECRHNRQDGTPCHQYQLVTGLDVCRKHGGKSLDRLRADGQQRVIEEQAARELARLDVPPVVNPLDELARIAGQAVAWKDVMAAKVNELTQLRYEGRGTGAEQIRAEIQLWERALDRCMAVLTAMVKLNIESRLAGVREATAIMLEQALQAALADCGLDLDGQARAQDRFRSRLKVVA